MKVILTSYGDITDKTKYDEVVYLVSSLVEDQPVRDEICFRIEDLDGSVETFLNNAGGTAIISVYTDADELVATYQFTGRYQRSEDFHFVDAYFKREILPTTATTANMTGIWDINILLKWIFNTTYQPLYIPGQSGNKYLNFYNTLSIPHDDYSQVSILKTAEYVFLAHQNKIVRWSLASPHIVDIYTIPQYTPTAGFTKASRAVYFSQQTATIQAKILGFRVESDIPYIYILTDEIYYTTTGALAGFYTVRKLRADTPSSLTLVKEKVLDPTLLSPTNVMMCNLSTFIPLSSNVDYFVWLRVQKDTSSEIASRIWAYLMDSNFNPSQVATIVADLRYFNQNARLFSDAYFYDSSKWAIVWGPFVLVKRGSDYYGRQVQHSGISAQLRQNPVDGTIFYDSAADMFSAYIFYCGQYVQVDHTSQGFQEYATAYNMRGGRNSMVAWLYSGSSANTYRTQAGTYTVPQFGLDILERAYFADDIFFAKVLDYVCIGKVEDQPNVSVYIEQPDTKITDIIAETKKILRGAILYSATSNQFVSTTSIPSSGNITQNDYAQVQEEADTRRYIAAKVEFADGHSGRNWLPEDTRFSHFCGIKGWHLLPYGERTKKYEIVSPNSYTVGAKYTFTDAEGRTLQALVASKYFQFDGLFRYTLITHTFPTTIVYEFPSDQPSWLVLETEFSHSVRTYGTHFEFSVLCRYRSTGWEHPTRVEYYVVAERTGDVVHYAWHPVSGRANILTIRWTGRLAENYWVYVYFYSAHAQHFALYNVRFYETVEEPKSATMTDLSKSARNPIYINPNAHFSEGMSFWESSSNSQELFPGDYIRTEVYFPTNLVDEYSDNFRVMVDFKIRSDQSVMIRCVVYFYDENLNLLPNPYEELLNIPGSVGVFYDTKRFEFEYGPGTKPKYFRVAVENASDPDDPSIEVLLFGIYYFIEAHNTQYLGGLHASAYSLVGHVHSGFSPLPPRPPGIDSHVVPYALAGASVGTLAVTARKLYAIPIVIWKKLFVDAIAINVTVEANGESNTCYVGIYNSDAGGKPTSLIGYVTFDVDTTGVIESNFGISLDIGVYWVAIVFSDSCTVRAITPSGLQILGLPDLGTTITTGFYVNDYSSLPATAPSSGWYELSGNVPAVGFKYRF